jgi:nucleotide-binding universal stress UspA family protein
VENKILVPLDNTEISEDLIKLADKWGQKTRSKLSFLHVINPDYSWSEEKTPLFEDRFEVAVSRYKLKSDYEVLFRVGKPYEKILELENELQPQLIFMAAHTHSILHRLFLGSNTDHVLHAAKTPVYVYKRTELELENKFLVPLDYTDVNLELIKKADEWAQKEDAKLVFLHVDELPEYAGNYYMMETGFFRKQDEDVISDMDTQEHDAEVAHIKNELNKYLAALEIKSPYETLVRFGIPYVKIMDVQKSVSARLIMLAAHSHTVIGRMIMGSNTDYLIHHVKCPLFVYKAVEGTA